MQEARGGGGKANVVTYEAFITPDQAFMQLHHQGIGPHVRAGEPNL